MKKRTKKRRQRTVPCLLVPCLLLERCCMKRVIALLAAALMMIGGGLAEEESDLLIEEIVEDVMLEEDGDEVPLPEVSFTSSGGDVFTPSHGSEWGPLPGEDNYWTLPMDITDEAAVWKMLMAPITVVDIGKKSGHVRRPACLPEPVRPYPE